MIGESIWWVFSKQQVKGWEREVEGEMDGWVGCWDDGRVSNTSRKLSGSDGGRICPVDPQ